MQFAYKITIIDYDSYYDTDIAQAIHKLNPHIALMDAYKNLKKLPFTFRDNLTEAECKRIQIELRQKYFVESIIEVDETHWFPDEDATKQTLTLKEQLFASDQNSYIPKCPTCGSPNLKKLDSLDGAISFAVWGFGSKKAGKSFKCKNCGYTW